MENEINTIDDLKQIQGTIKPQNKPKKPQRIQIDNRIPENGNIDYKAILIYAYLSKYADKNSRETFVSLDTLAEKTQISKPTISKKIRDLEVLGCLSIRKEGKKNVYTLKKPPRSLRDKEEFTMQFLDDKTLSPIEKAGILMLQNKMEKNDQTGNGVIRSLTMSSVASLMGIRKTTAITMFDSMKQKGVVSTKDSDYTFNLNLIGQAVLFLAVQVSENTEDIKDLKVQLQASQEKTKMLQERVYSLETTLEKLQKKIHEK